MLSVVTHSSSGTHRGGESTGWAGFGSKRVVTLTARDQSLVSP